MEKPTVPTLHLNGSGAKSLYEDYAAATAGPNLRAPRAARHKRPRTRVGRGRCSLTVAFGALSGCRAPKDCRSSPNPLR